MARAARGTVARQAPSRSTRKPRTTLRRRPVPCPALTPGPGSATVNTAHRRIMATRHTAPAMVTVMILIIIRGLNLAIILSIMIPKLHTLLRSRLVMNIHNLHVIDHIPLLMHELIIIGGLTDPNHEVVLHMKEEIDLIQEIEKVVMKKLKGANLEADHLSQKDQNTLLVIIQVLGPGHILALHQGKIKRIRDHHHLIPLHLTDLIRIKVVELMTMIVLLHHL